MQEGGGRSACQARGVAVARAPRPPPLAFLAPSSTPRPPPLPQEVLCGEYDAARADVWSCGVLAYVLLSGRPPFEGARTEEVFRRIRDDGVPDM